MKIILKENIENLGKAGEIVEVKNGYARNYLIPSSKAIAATPSNMKAFKEEIKLLEKKALKGKLEAEELAAKLEKVSITASVQVGEDDKVFGAITNQNIADLLKEQNYDIDRKKIILEEPLKALGVYDVPVKLHPEVEVKIKIWVVRS